MKKLTRAKAIKEYCLECMGCDLRRAQLMGRNPCGNGPVQASQLIRECEDIFCALYNYRTGLDQTPGQAKRIPTTRQKTVWNNLKSRQKLKRIATCAQS